MSQLFLCAMSPFSSSLLFFCSLRVGIFKSPSSIQLLVIFLILAHLAWIKDFKDPLDIQSNSFISPGHLLNGRKEGNVTKEKHYEKCDAAFSLSGKGMIWISRPTPRNCIQMPACSSYNAEKPS